MCFAAAKQQEDDSSDRGPTNRLLDYAVSYSVNRWNVSTVALSE